MSKKKQVKPAKRYKGQKLTRQQKALVKRTIKSLIARNPFKMKTEIVREITEKFGIHERTAWRYVKEVENHSVVKLTDTDVQIAVSQFAAAIEETERYLWRDLSHPDPRVRQNAIRLIIQNRKHLFDILMDTGIIVRQLGEQNVKHAFIGALAVKMDNKEAKSAYLELRDYIEKRLEDIGIKLKQ